jgi:hypothetical protein
MGRPRYRRNLDRDIAFAPIDCNCTLGTRRHLGRRRSIYVQRFFLA